MKSLSSIFSIIIALSIIGCATAGETKNPNVALKNIHAEIAKLEQPIADATKKLEATLKWQEFMKLKAEYLNKAKEVSKLPEFIELNRLEKANNICSN